MMPVWQNRKEKCNQKDGATDRDERIFEALLSRLQSNAPEFCFDTARSSADSSLMECALKLFVTLLVDGQIH